MLHRRRRRSRRGAGHAPGRRGTASALPCAAEAARSRRARSARLPRRPAAGSPPAQAEARGAVAAIAIHPPSSHRDEITAAELSVRYLLRAARGMRLLRFAHPLGEQRVGSPAGPRPAATPSSPATNARRAASDRSRFVRADGPPAPVSVTIGRLPVPAARARIGRPAARYSKSLKFGQLRPGRMRDQQEGVGRTWRARARSRGSEPASFTRIGSKPPRTGPSPPR